MSVKVDIPYGAIRDSVRGIDDYVQRIYAGRRYQIAEEFIDTVTPFVPIKTGVLRSSATIIDNGYAVEWSATNPKNGYNYAPKQYEEIGYNHPRGGYAEWDQVAMAYEGEAFIEKVKDILAK